MLRKVAGYLVAVVIFISTLVGLLCLFEKSEPPHPQRDFKVHYSFERDGDPTKFPHFKEFGFSGAVRIRARKEFQGKTLYDVSYKLNDYGLRELPLVEPDKAREFLIINGCSYSFGEGLELSATFPYLLEQKDVGVNVYDISFMGGGLNTAHRYLDVMDITKFVKEKTGQIVYVFMTNHLDRWFIRANILPWANGNFPHYKIVDDKVVYKGLLSEQGAYQSYHSLAKSGLKDSALKLSTLADGKEQDEWARDELHEFAIGVRELKGRYQKLFPSSRFAIMIHPNAGLINNNNLLLLKEELEGQGVEVWDAQTLHNEKIIREKIPWDSFQIPVDGHPNELMNLEMVKYFESFSQKKGQARK